MDYILQENEWRDRHTNDYQEMNLFSNKKNDDSFN